MAQHRLNLKVQENIEIMHVTVNFWIFRWRSFGTTWTVLSVCSVFELLSEPLIRKERIVWRKNVCNEFLLVNELSDSTNILFECTIIDVFTRFSKAIVFQFFIRVYKWLKSLKSCPSSTQRIRIYSICQSKSSYALEFFAKITLVYLALSRSILKKNKQITKK